MQHRSPILRRISSIPFTPSLPRAGSRTIVRGNFRPNVFVFGFALFWLTMAYLLGGTLAVASTLNSMKLFPYSEPTPSAALLWCARRPPQVGQAPHSAPWLSRLQIKTLLMASQPIGLERSEAIH